MINISHVYAYYGAHNALKGCIDNNVQFMLTTDNESALSIVVKNCDTENRVLNELVYHLTKSLARDKEKDELDFREQCMVSSHLRPIQY